MTNKSSTWTDKQFEKLFKWIWDVTIAILKRTWVNVKAIHPMFKTKEKYFLFIAIIITFSFLFWKKAPVGFYFLGLFNYFFIKGLIQELKENAVSIRYKGLSNLFDNKIKVVSAKEGTYILNSYIPVQEIEKNKHRIEHFLNREIVKIERNKKNFRCITIKTELLKFKTGQNLNKIYLFEKYLPQILLPKNYDVPFVVGVDSKGFLILDQAKLIHTFIAGTAGGGKSNLLNVIIQSMMYFNSENLAFIMADFKGGVEMWQYSKFKNTIIIETQKDFQNQLEKLNDEMNNRYQLLKKHNVKKIQQYNQLGNKLPYIILVIDEISDIRLSQEADNKRIEELLTRILNQGRAGGIFVIGATQRPSGVQLSTEIRDRFDTKISARIKDKNTQKMAGIHGTENLKVGEFLMNTDNENTNKFKSFLIDEIKHNEVYKKLLKNMSGGVNFDKNI